MKRDELLRELRFLLSDGRHYGGADAILAIARGIWWTRPLAWLSKVPGMPHLVHVGYHKLAAQRNCAAVVCAAELSRR